MSKRVVKVISIIFVLIMLLTLLIACNAQTYKHRLEDKGYTAYYIEINEDSIKDMSSLAAQLKNYGLSVDDLKWTIIAVDQIHGKDSVTIYHFKNKKCANTFYSYFDKETHEDDYLLEIDGKDIFYGTEKGINDARNR